MKIFRLFLAFIVLSAGFPISVFAEQKSLSELVDEDMTNFRIWWEEHLSNFGKNGKPSAANEVRAVGAAYGNNYKTYNGYDEVASTPEGKAALLSQLPTLASVMAKTAGTSSASVNAAKLSTVAGKLSASKDPDLQEAGKILGEEAKAIASGDTVAADNTVSTMSNLSSSFAGQAGTYGGSGRKSESMDALKKVIGGLLASATGGIGSVAVAAILGALGIGGGSMEGIADSGVKSLTSGNSADSTGAAAINSAGAEVNKDLNTVSTGARKSVSSSGTSGAPSSK